MISAKSLKDALAALAMTIAALALLLFGLALQTQAQAPQPPPAIAQVPLETLPHEARQTLRLIDRGGPYPYRKDGTVFGNREKRLPQRPHGYYREFTVATPGAPDRGARRIVAGREGERYYTADHYRSFRRIVP